MKNNLEQFAGEICRKYRDGMSSSKLAKEYNSAPTPILRLLRKYGVSIKDKLQASRDKAIPVNDDFFYNIDSEVKAYLLGIMFSDGHVHSLRPEISLGLTDLDIITLFRDNLGSGLKILNHKKKDPNSKQGYVVRLTSMKVKNDLIRHGCHPVKSLTLAFPAKMSCMYWSHFIRGYFDGDGCITVTNRTSKASFVGTRDFLLSVKTILNGHGINCGHIIPKVSGSNNAHEIKIDKLSLIKLRGYMYNGSTVYMDRKLNKFNQLI